MNDLSWHTIEGTDTDLNESTSETAVLVVRAAPGYEPPPSGIRFAVSGTASVASGSLDATITGFTMSTGTGSVSFPVGARDSVGITVAALNDSVTSESTETIVLTLPTAQGGESITININNNSSAPDKPVVSYQDDKHTATEGTTINRAVNVIVDPVSPTSTVLRYTVGSSEGDPGATAATVTIPAWEGRYKFRYSVPDDNRAQGDRLRVYTLSTHSSYTVKQERSTFVVDIRDDDVAEPSITIAGSAASVTEGGPAQFTLTVSPVPITALDVNVRVTEVGTFISGAKGDRTVTIPANTAATLFDVDTSDDAVDEANGSITAAVRSGSGYTLGSPSTATVTVNDNDVQPSISIAAGSAVAEGGDAMFTLTAAPIPAANVSVDVDVTETGTFISGSKGTRTVLLSAGTATATFVVGTDDDSIDESHGSVTATVEAGDGYTVGVPRSASVPVNDDDGTTVSKPVVTVAAGATSVTEGDAITFTLTAIPAPTQRISVEATVSGVNVEQFVGSTSRGMVSVPIEASQTMATFTVPTTGDMIDEPDGTVALTIADSSGYTVGSVAVATVTVNDDDGPTMIIDPVRNINPGTSQNTGPSTVHEGTVIVTVGAATPSRIAEGESAVFTVTLEHRVGQRVHVYLEFDSEFGLGSDYSAEARLGDDGAWAPMGQTVQRQVIAFPAGTTEATVRITAVAALIGDDTAIAIEVGERSFAAGSAADIEPAGGTEIVVAGRDDGGGTQSEEAHLVGAERWTESDCTGDKPIVVASDAAAQSDIYSAVTLAGAIDTDCVVLAGPREGIMHSSQAARLLAAAAGGVVIGGTAAVPAAKVAGRDMTRIGGADRWFTAQWVGAAAASGIDSPAPPGTSVPDNSFTAAAHGAYLVGAEPWIASDCTGDRPIVVASDAAAQSDIYNAFTLAGVVGSDCVVLAGPRTGNMPAFQMTRLRAASANGGFVVVVGGTAAVSPSKVAGHELTRLGGPDRWTTAHLVGRFAAGDSSVGTSATDESADSS